MAAPELPKEDWDLELTFPPCPLNWEQAVSQAAATESDEANVGDYQVEIGDEGMTTWTVPKADAWGDNPVEPSNGGPDATIKGTAETEAPGGRFTTKTQTGESQIGAPAEEGDIMIEEEEEPEVPNEETVVVTDAAWGLKDTTLKVVDEDPGATQAPITALMPGQEGTLDFEGMPNLEDIGSGEIIGEEPPVDIPPTEGSPALPWVCFEAQIHQDEVQYWAAMFTWF